MVKFYTITQKGYTFVRHDADTLVPDEEWELERVAAFMSIHRALNVMATKYCKGMTFRPALASIQYTLECDPVTSHDLNKLTGVLVPKLCEMYSTPETQGYLGRPLSLILDDVVKLTKDYIHEKEQPVEVLGQVVTPAPFLTRPSKEDYDKMLEAESAKKQSIADKFKDELNSGKAIGHRISIKEGCNVYTGVIVKITDRCVYCDVKDEYGNLLQNHARFPRTSPRFILNSYR